MYALRRLLLLTFIASAALIASSAGLSAGSTLQISNVKITALAPQSAQITWTTNDPATDQVSYGLDQPVIWTKVSDSDTTVHTVTLDNLTFSTAYNVHLLSADASGQTARAQLTVTTPPLGKVSSATTSGGVITVNGQQVLPLMVFEVCQDGFQNDLEAGINLFMGDQCGENQFDGLSGNALTVGDIQNRQYSGNGFIGWFYQDEWDAHLHPPFTASQLQMVPPSSQTGRITFLDMTSHFYRYAASWPGWTTNDWQTLESVPDVLGTDLYPLTSWCNANAFAADEDAQQQLAATGKPTFQWIETRAMDCGNAPEIRPTADTVRVETWLALIGQAHAIGYFPNDFKGPIKAEITAQNRQITALAPALLSPQQPATVTPSGQAPLSTPVMVSVRSLNGAVYIILANSSRQAQTFKVTVPGLGSRPITTYDRTRTLTPVLDSFTDSLPGLGTRVYIATPDGS